MTRPALRVVDADGQLHDACPGCEERDDKITGLEATVDLQARKLGNLTRKLERDQAEEANHPRGAEITALIERWKKATDHPRAKVSKDRVDVVKARLKDGYSMEQLELAVDGIAAFPFVINGKRVSAGKPSQRHDALSIALKGGENLERFANLGHRARVGAPHGQAENRDASTFSVKSNNGQVGGA